MIEQTLSIIKPDAVERNIANKIKVFFEKNNLKLTSNGGERNYFAQIENLPNSKIIYLHAKEIIQRLGDGTIDIGISGLDLLQESSINLQKKIGKILHIDANFSASGALKYKKKIWRANRKESPGGAIAGLGIHMIDLMCYFGGKVKSVQSLVKKYAVKVNMDDTTSALFELKNCTGNLTTIFVCPYTTTFNIFATNMNIFSDVDKNKIKI